MSSNPYKSQSDKAFWSRSVSSNYEPTSLINTDVQLLRKSDRVTSAGSCFASNMVPYIESAGLTYLRTEQLPAIFSDLGENLGYANFSAAYGNIYTVRQLLQLYMRTLGEFEPKEDRWFFNGNVIDPFRPGLKYPASSNAEFDLMKKSHLSATREAFESADVFVFTFGLTEGWISRQDGATYPACPGTISGVYSENKYNFVNFSVDEIIQDMSLFIDKLRKRNPKIRFILSVSPVPLVATATKNHVLTASIYSKSVLRVAAEELSKNLKNVNYFPAYEIITGPQAPQNFFENDKRNVSSIGVEFVMQTLLASSGLSQFSKNMSLSNRPSSIQELSKTIAQADCDEVMLDQK